MSARWKIATALNRTRLFCWAELVTWALRRGSTTLRQAAHDGSCCRAESLTHRDRTCYCGKFRDGCRRRSP